MGPEFLLFLCVAANLALGHRGTKTSHDEEKARLPEFLTELDLASLEASEEDVEALKKIVKRLAPEKNGEYQVYQGVVGQPGVDFPALTTIPRTAFSCRGLKGGYFADLETNCQVFHICDNGRKISFLCPNGTIFQQSQLICDWWFKVDCGKSVDFYEQSSEQLAEDERKRAEARKMNSEFHRVTGSEDGRTYHQQTQNSNYDGRQNGRTNPFGQTANGQNEIQSNQGANKSNQPFGQNYLFNAQSNGRTGNGNGQEGEVVGQTDESYNQKESQSSENNFNNYNGNSNSYQSRQQNQLVENQNGKSRQFGNYNQRNGNNQNSQDYYGSSVNPKAQQEEKQNARNSKSRTTSRNNLNSAVQRVTPLYTETTTFRTTTGNPVKEYQQLAESAAFASSRGNRYNKAYSSNQFNNFYTNRIPSTENFQQESSTALPAKEINGKPLFGSHPGIPAYPFPTFAPIYKPRTTTTTASTVSAYENQQQTTTQNPNPTDNNYYRQDSISQTVSQTTYSSLDTVTATPYPKSLDGQGPIETVASYGNTENYQRSTEPPEIYTDGSESMNPSTQRPYVNTETYRQSTVSSVTSRSFENSERSSEDSMTVGDYNEASGAFSTARPYLNTESYRQNGVTSSTNGDTVAQDYGESSNAQPSLVYQENTSSTSSSSEKPSQPEVNGQWSGPTSSTKDVSGTRQDYRANSISASTEKPFRSTQSYQQSAVTSRTSSPYDKSFTYRQGKIYSTLGPYIPFTKNYAYTTTTTTTTQKPPAYTATVPTYSSTSSVYRTTQNNLVPRVQNNNLSTIRSKESATYLPEKTTETPAYLPKNFGFEKRPLTEQERAIDMLHSLQDLESSTSLNRYNNNNSRSGLNIPASSGPSTLHSLALYFATATDKFDSNEEQVDTAVKIESKSNVDDKPVRSNNSADLPKTLLTEHTITSYAELFNLNNALDNSTSTENRFGESDDENDASLENNNDLDLQQSEGPLSGVRKSNNTKLRELAQVFTHALSAYLQDPDTFKKVLTEIRPTEPPSTTSDEATETTTVYPTTTSEDYSSVTKEKDEVLDFSDVTKASRRRRPTTPYPTTTHNSNLLGETTYQTLYTSPRDYYTTSPDNQYSTASPALASDVALNEPQNIYYGTAQEPAANSFAYEVNNAFGTSNNDNGVRNYDTRSNSPSDATGSDRASNVYENYFPTGSSSVNNRFGGFQNNTINTPEPYGKYVKPFDATPISDNYVVSSTPTSYAQGSSAQENVKTLSGNLPNDELAPPFYDSYDDSENGVTPHPFDADVSNSLAAGTKTSSTTPLSKKSIQVSSSRQPLRINYYETTASPWRNSQESLKAAGSLYANYRNRYKEITTENSKPTETPSITSTVLTQTGEPITASSAAETTARLTTIVQDPPVTTMQSSGSTYSYTSQAMGDHWTSSPTVTKLWETTVYIDPNHINNALSSDDKLGQSTLDSSATESVEYGTTPAPKDSLVTGATNGLTTQNYNNGDNSAVRDWTRNSNDSPTAFTLLPTAYGKDTTGTPTPTYTTHSSITTTITSSVSSTSALPRDNLAQPALPSRINENAFNVTENEIIKAQEMFGNLNASSSNTLMRVMKQAENNTMVRQLVLLLVNHCNAPTNETTEREKEQLLNTLLRMPVNEFSRDESREIIDTLNRLNLPTVRSRVSMGTNSRSLDQRPSTTSTSVTTSSAPSITTFRSKTRRRFKSTTENPTILSRRSDDAYTGETKNSLPSVSASASDNRALDLLRSLYTIAAKWG